jgi:MHS family proline/betaine transporter-like MFS transporter
MKVLPKTFLYGKLKSKNNTELVLNRNTIGGVVGNILEWYDFAVFAYFSPILAHTFFPSFSPASSLLATFSTFALAYVMRPFGGMIFGYIGDKLGRKKALQVSILMMAVSTTGMGLLPSYEMVGLFAPVLLVLFRLLQGLSVGGELIGSISFVTEMAPIHRRGFLGSFTMSSATTGIMIGSLAAALCHSFIPAEILTAWAWRIPFLAGILLGIFGLWMRSGLIEPPEFTLLKKDGKLADAPVTGVISAMPATIIKVVMLVTLEGGGFYLLFVWWPTFLTQFVDPPIPSALLINTLSMLVLMILTPVAGWLSDDVGRNPVMGVASVCIIIFSYPLFLLATTGAMWSAFLAQLIFAVFMSGVIGPLPAALAEMFPPKYRYSGIALGYNLALALFGGTAPLISTWLIMKTNNLMAPSIYLIFLAIITFYAILIRNPQFEGTSFWGPKKKKRKRRHRHQFSSRLTS